MKDLYLHFKQIKFALSVQCKTAQEARGSLFDHCLYMLPLVFQGRTGRPCRLPVSGTSRALQGKGASILPGSSSYASPQSELPLSPGSEGGRSPVSSVLPTPTSTPAQRTLPTRCSTFPSPAPKSARLSGNGQTSAPRGQSRPLPLPNPGPSTEEPHDCSRIDEHHQDQPSPEGRTSNRNHALPRPDDLLPIKNSRWY